MVTVCYQSVNGRTGAVFDDAFARSTSAEIALPDVVTGFRTALVGQRSGATVVTAVTAADGSSSVVLAAPMSTVALIAANAFVVFFGVSWGPVMWVLLGEMFPNKIRGAALAVGANGLRPQGVS